MHQVKSNKNIQIAFFINLSFTIIELFGGLYVNSMAIISDSLHDLGDSFSLGLAWYFQKLSNRKADHIFTFGYHRFSVLGALFNALILLIGSGFIIYNSIFRIMDPEVSNPNGMLVLSILGIAINFAGAYILSKESSLNEKVIRLHLLEDVLGWVAVLIVSIVLLFQPWYILDPILSLGITIYILVNVFKNLKETVNVFLQTTPGDVDIKEIESKILELEHVDSTHHIHSWSLDGDHHVLTAHIRLKSINDLSMLNQVKHELNQLLEPYKFVHTTIQTDFAQENCPMDTNNHKQECLH